MPGKASGIKYGHIYSHGKAEYLQFRHAFGHLKGILVSHAVWMAAGRSITPGYTIDHINGCTTYNHITNLRCIDIATNQRDAGFLRKLRNKGIDPTAYKKCYLLRYFERMAVFKASHSHWQYRSLSREQLLAILVSTEPTYKEHFVNCRRI